MLSQAEKWLLVEKYQGVESPAFFADCQKLSAGEPLAYLIGHIPFLNCQIWLDSHPLIPRPETEFWVERAIKKIHTSCPRVPLGQEVWASDMAPHLLDLCAGSGCIGVAVAKAIPIARVDFGEIDPSHLATIQKNLETNQLNQHNHQIIQSDLFKNITKRYDFILSNPPYIDPVIDRAETSVKTHEPHRALYGGQNGLELIRTIIAEAPAHLNPQGQLWLEHEPEQSKTIQALGQANGFSVTTHQDQYNVERYTILVLQ